MNCDDINQTTIRSMIYPGMTQNITPRSAVDGIAHLLTRTGELKGDDEAISLLDSMKEATLLFQKAIYLEVLKITASEKTLTTYLSKGGWDLLNSWLSEAKKTANTALALEILEVLQHVPVTLVLLKQGNMGKIMKSYNKSEDKEIKKKAGELMDSWMKLVPTAGSGKKKKANDDGLTKKDQLVPKKASSKSVHLAESLGFLDAISSTSKTNAPRKIRKRSSTDVDLKRSNSLSETPESSPLPRPSKVDKLSQSVDKPASPKVEPKIKPEMLLTNSPPPLPDKSHGNDKMFCFRRAKKRRRIRWRDELEDVQFFECEEKSASHKSFSESMSKEYEKERQAVLRSRQLGEDMMVEMTPWKHPLKLDASMLTLAEKGASSKEKELQREREKNVLAVLVFDQNAMMESPKEPDADELNYTYVTPTIIPLTDSSQSQPTPEPAPERVPEPSTSPQHHQQSRYNESSAPQQLPPVLANMLPAQQPMLMQSMPEMLPHPDQYSMPVQRYPNQQNQVQQQQQQYHPVPPGQPNIPTYNSYNPDNRSYDSHNRNGRDNYNKRGDGGWNYRKGGHGGRQYRDWIDSDRRREDHPRYNRPRKPCAYFNTKMGCREGNNCKFIHETGLHGTIPGQYNRWDDRDGRDHRDRGVHLGRDSEDKDSGKHKDSSDKSESQENKSPSATSTT